MKTLDFQMLRIRRIEEAIANEYTKQEMRCPVHLSIGQEAIAVGVCINLRKTDKVYSGHRAHAHYLAKGGDLNRFIAELYGKATGCCGGRGGSMHLQDVEAGFMGSTAIVGGTISLAVGSAFADKIKGNDNVTVIFLGDGAFEEGVTQEAMNFAVLHSLAVVFVLENNGLAVTTPLKERQLSDHYKIAEGYGLAVIVSPYANIEEISYVVSFAIENARAFKIPQFLEFKTERQRVHCGVEYEYALKNDQVRQGTPEEELMIQQEIEAAFEFARNSPIPTNPERGVYAE